MNPIRLSTVAFAAALVAGAACAQAPSAPAAPMTGATASPMAPQPEMAGPATSAWRPISPAGDILATLQASGQFTVLVKALGVANLATLVKTHPDLTLFAPTDAAFAALPPSRASALSSADQAQRLLAYHLVNTRLDTSKIAGGKGPVPTAAQTPVIVDGASTPAKVNDANVLQAAVPASNGVIYVIDRVLDPTYTPPPAPAEPAPTTP